MTDYDPDKEVLDVFRDVGTSQNPKFEVQLAFPGGLTQLFKDDPSAWTDEQLRVGHAALVRSAQAKANGCWLWLALGVGAYFLHPLIIIDLVGEQLTEV